MSSANPSGAIPDIAHLDVAHPTDSSSGSHPSPVPAPARTGVPAAIRRVWSIGRAEGRLFLRNPTILLTALGLPVVMVVVFMGAVAGDASSGAGFTTFLVNTLLQWALLLVVYYNLTTIFVSRREDGVFQRMSTGEATPWEAVAAASLPSVAVLLTQLVAGGAVSAWVFGVPSMTNLPLVMTAALLGCVTMVAMAAWTSSFTSTVEGAQYSTLPVFFVLMFLSGLSFPLDFLSDTLQRIASLTPLHAVADLVSLGMSGVTLGADASSTPGFAGSWSEALDPLAVLLAWTVVMVWLARTTMRFTRRR